MSRPRSIIWRRVAGRASASLAIVLATALGAAGAVDAAAPESRSPRVAIVFLPGPPPKSKPAMIERLAAYRGLALGFVSSVLGPWSPEQVLVDIGAGARARTSLYEGELPPDTGLVPVGRGGRVRGWAEIAERAETPPAEVVPGSLGGAVRQAGGTVAYVGFEGVRNREALAAADTTGRIANVSVGDLGSTGVRALRQWRRASLLVARLPSGQVGSRALAALLRARRAQDLVIVVERPGASARRLLAAGAAGLGEGSTLRSRSTRTDGLVVATDLAPTALVRLAVDIPSEISGQPIESAGDEGVEQLVEFKDRLSDVGPRRWHVVLLGLLSAALLAAFGSARAANDRRRRVVRAAFLAALWLPAVLLATAALAPSRAAEIVVIAAACAVLALGADRLLGWPRAIVAPAAVTVLSYVADLVFGSTLIGRSLLGPNPILGARFFGVGNELEVTLAVIGLLGLGAALATASARVRVWAFVTGGAALAFSLSWGKLGADVGASVMLAAGTATAAVYSVSGRSVRRRVAIVIGAPALALALLAAVDLVTGGDAHFTRFVLQAGGLDELADTVQRRYELSYESLRRGIIPLLVVMAIAALALGYRSRRRLLAPIEGMPGLRAGTFGALVAVVAGALTNDSGPMMLLIGTVYLALCAGYFQAAPNAEQ